METTAPPSPILGADLRSLRHARGLTLQQLAGQLQRSVGWLSQVERDMSQLSVADLRRIARALDVPVSLLFSQADAPQHESGYVVRRTARRPIGTRIPGLVEELLSPDLTDDFEVVHSTFAPHSRLKKPTNRPTQELGFWYLASWISPLQTMRFVSCQAIVSASAASRSLGPTPPMHPPLRSG